MPEAIPAFEGRPVAGSVIKMTGNTLFDDLTEFVVGMDDRVQILVVATCVGVHHDVNEKTGEIIRVQKLRVAEAMPTPFDGIPGNDGILRALPSAAFSGTTALADDGDDDE